MGGTGCFFDRFAGMIDAWFEMTRRALDRRVAGGGAKTCITAKNAPLPMTGASWRC